MVDPYYFAGLNFVNVSTRTHYVLYNRAFFAGLIFAVRRSFMKTTKIGPLQISHYTVASWKFLPRENLTLAPTKFLSHANDYIESVMIFNYSMDKN